MKKWSMFENLIQFGCAMFSYYNSGIKFNFQTFVICLFVITEFAVKSQIIANPLELSYPQKEIFLCTNL